MVSHKKQVEKKAAKIFWNETEKVAVLYEAACYKKDNPKASYAACMLNGMNRCKGIVRERPEISVCQGAKATWGAKIDQELERLKLEDKIIAEAQAENSEEIAISNVESVGVDSSKLATSTSPLAFNNLSSLIDQALDKLKLDLKALFRQVEEVVEAGTILATTTGFNKGTQRLEALGFVVNRSPAEVPAVNLKGADVKHCQEKVGYVGGAQRGTDITLVRNGLDEVYDFRIVDDLSKLKSLKDCSVLVRSHKCSHPLWKAAQRLSPNAKHLIELSPNAVNEALLERYVKGVQNSGSASNV